MHTLDDQTLAESAKEKLAEPADRVESGVRSESKNLSPGEALLNSISHNTDFPTFSKHIIEINRQISARSKKSSASDLSNAILKDYALTSKLLKLVNSAYYSITGGKVTTITRAVVLLGYETVRMAATNLLLFDLMKSKFSPIELKEAFVTAFWSGMMAKDTAAAMSVKDEEEAFICAMLHNLGRHIVMLYRPEKYTEISDLILIQGYSAGRASKAVLGISFEDLGIAVAKRWKFPPKIVGSMERLTGEDLRNSRRKINVLKSLSNFCNELCSIVNNTTGKERAASFANLASQYKNLVPISSKQLAVMVDDSLEKVSNHAELLDINIEHSKFLHRLTVSHPKQQQNQDGQNPAMHVDPVVSKVLVDRGFYTNASEKKHNEARQTNPVEVILSGIQDISEAMAGKFEVNDIALMALESMYRGFGFHRVIFFTMRKDNKRLEARFGLGSDIDQIVKHLYFEINDASNIFSIALAKGKDLVIEDIEKQHIIELIPKWFRQKIKSPSFAFLPITLKDTCLGAFYVDREIAGPPLRDGQYKYITMLRNHLILAIKYRR